MARPEFPPARAGWATTFLLVGLPILVGLGVYFWSTQPTIPSREESEQYLASAVGSRERTTVTAACDEPDGDGWTCRLRDAAGRYGWAAGSATNDSVDGSRYLRADKTTYTWGFPVAPDGTVREEITPPGQGRIGGALLFVTYNALKAVDGGFPPTFDCPTTIAVGSTATCTGAAPIPTVSVTRLDETRFEVAFVVPIPERLIR